jgi:hypothetical protein
MGLSKPELWKECAECKKKKPSYLFGANEYKKKTGECKNCRPPHQKKGKKKRRICLKCDVSFMSFRNMRICLTCKSGYEFEIEAYSFYDPYLNHLFL